MYFLAFLMYGYIIQNPKKNSTLIACSPSPSTMPVRGKAVCSENCESECNQDNRKSATRRVKAELLRLVTGEQHEMMGSRDMSIQER